MTLCEIHRFPCRWAPLLAGVLLFAAGCRSLRGAEGERPENTRSAKARPLDDAATEETRALYAHLQQLQGVMFGHQDDLAYGVHWTSKDDRPPGRSDVKETAGAYPAVYGWELGDLSRPGATENLDGVNFDKMKRWIKKGYGRGGVITLSWHMRNPVTGGSAWDTTRAVSQLLPGGTRHAEYTHMLDRFASFVRDLKTDEGFLGLWGGTPIPVIFRPFHEMSGFWFWWGEGHVTPENYKKLWRFTVHYLRDEKDLHNLLYAYSTDGLGKLDDYQQYYRYYPGDAYVDVMGFDDYSTFQSRDETSGRQKMIENVKWLTGEAAERGKVSAITETGMAGLDDATYWTKGWLPVLKATEGPHQIAYMMVWRNANEDQKEGHFFAPYPGQKSAKDFRAFKQDPLVLFEDELPPMYRMP